MLSKPIRTQLARFCVGEVDPQTFESWVCEDVGIEGELGHGVYLDLVAADYLGRDVGGARERCERVLDDHHPGMLKRYRVTRILESMIRDGSALLPGLRQLVRLYHQGYEFIPIEFVGYESETDSIPDPQTYHHWDPAALARVLSESLPYQEEIRKDAIALLEDLRRRYPDAV